MLAAGHLLRSGKYVAANLPGVTVLPRCKVLTVRARNVTACSTRSTDKTAAAASGVLPRWELDGEAQGLCDEVHVQLLPGALQLCV